MDSSFRILHALHVSGISARVRVFMDGAREAAGDRPWLRPLLHSLILLPIALLLGSWAREHAKSEAVAEYEEAHLPREGTWRAILESKGYVELPPGIEDAEARRRLRGLRANGALSGESWLSQDDRWIALMDERGIPLLFERNDECRRSRLEGTKVPHGKAHRRRGAKGTERLPVLREITRPRGAPNVAWDHPGRGWRAFESVLPRLDRTAAKVDPCVEKTLRRPPASGHDPREIRF